MCFFFIWKFFWAMFLKSFWQIGHKCFVSIISISILQCSCHWLLLTNKLYEHLNLAVFFSPIQGWYWQDRALDWVKTAVDFTFVQNELGLFNYYFLKLTWKLSFSTSFTYTLTPSTSSLVNSVAVASKQRFTVASWCGLNFIPFLIFYVVILEGVHSKNQALPRTE